MVSIIIPTTGQRPEWLKEAVASAEKQTYKDIEIIVKSSPACVSKNINDGIREAKGEFIKLCADDDLLLPRSVEFLVNGIKGYDFVCGNAQEFGDRTGVYKSKPASLESLLAHNTLHGGTMLYRKDILLEVGGFDEDLICAEEYDLHLALLQKGYKLGYVDEIVFFSRAHGGQKSNGGLNQFMRMVQIEEIKARYESG